MRKLFMIGVILMGIGMTASGADVSLKDQRQLMVQGHGKAEAVPDVAKIDFGVTEEGPKIDDLTAAVQSKMAALFKMLKTHDIAEKDMQSQGYIISPIERYDNGKTTRVGYTVSDRLEVTVRDIQKTGALLTQGQNMGANSITGPRFEFDNPQVLERRALALAMDDAKAKATLLAQSAGAALGEVLLVEEDHPNNPRQFHPIEQQRMAFSSNIAPAEPIAAGENTEEASVQVTYALH